MEQKIENRAAIVVDRGAIASIDLPIMRRFNCAYIGRQIERDTFFQSYG